MPTPLPSQGTMSEFPTIVLLKPVIDTVVALFLATTVNEPEILIPATLLSVTVWLSPLMLNEDLDRLLPIT